MTTAPFDLRRYQDPLTIQRLLRNSKSIAIVGLSNNPLRASYFVGFYLKRHGYHVIPVNPREKEILGERSYASLRDVPEPVDMVNVFRAPDALPGHRARRRRDRREVALDPVHCHQRGGREDRRGRRARSGHGSMSQGRARSLRRPHALARLQHGARHVAA